MLDIKVLSNLDLQKIQDYATKTGALILVGFPSGRQHIQAQHRNQDGEYKDYNGNDYDDAEPVDTADLARALHFGTQNTPARPFLEDGINSKRNEIEAAIKKEEQQIKDGNSANWSKIGAMAVGAIQELVRGDFYKTRKPNSQKTIEYKGSDTPLVDSADMINALSFVVEE